MNCNRKFLGAASVAAIAMSMASSVYADPPVFGGTTGSAPTQTVVNGTSSTTTTGSETVAPYTAVTTTVQNQNVNSTTAPTTTAVSDTYNGVTSNGSITVSGTGTQARTSTTTLTQIYNPGPPPTPNGPPTPGGPTYANVGSATVTAISATGSFGGAAATPTYAGVLTSGSTITNSSVVATENDVYQSTSGVQYLTYVGTATYDPSSGNVTVALPNTPTASTSIGSGGITTTGTISASAVNATSVTATTVSASDVSTNTLEANHIALTPAAAGDEVIDAGGGKITNLANGTAPGDAVNLFQLQNGLNHFRKQAASGTAVAAAMSGAYFLPGKKFNVSVNLSDYLGEGAFAFNAGYLITPNIAVNAGVASGFSYGGTAGRIGATYGF